jgi:hypothetical protein
MPIHPKVKTVGYVAIVYAALLGLSAALHVLPHSQWGDALIAGLGPVLAFAAGWATPSGKVVPSSTSS